MIKKFIITKKTANEEEVFKDFQLGEDLGFAGIREPFKLYTTAESANETIKRIEERREDLNGIYGVFEITFKSDLA